MNRDEMERLLYEVRDKVGAAVRKQIMREVGGIKRVGGRMRDIPDDRIQAVIDAAQTKLNEGNQS